MSAPGRPRNYDLQHLRRTGQPPAERVPEMVPFCWFCDRTEGKHTREHLFPKWLRELYNDGKFRPVRYVPTAAVAGMDPWEDSRKADFDVNNLVAGNVCADCNNGWMSELEVAAKPLLAAVDRTAQLSEMEATTLAHWFAKTSAVVNVSQPYRLLWPEDRRHAIARGDLEHILVSLARLERADLNYVQSNPESFLYEGNMSARLRRLMALTHQCSIQVGPLVGTVLALPAELVRDEVFTKRTPLFDRGRPYRIQMRKIAKATSITDAGRGTFVPTAATSAFTAN